MHEHIAKRLSPVIRESLNDKICGQIKTLILSKGIEVGQKLPSERVLASQFQVSRGAVRQALKSLEQSGYINIRTGTTGGAFVADNLHLPLFRVTYDLFSAGQLTLSHFYEARKAIECISVRLAAQEATPEDIEHLRTLNRKLIEDLDGPAKLGETRVLECHAAFHLAMAEISGNPLIKLIVHSVMALFWVVFTGWSQLDERKMSGDAYQRHEEILRAMEARDLIRCEELMAVDTDWTKTLVLKE